MSRQIFNKRLREHLKNEEILNIVYNGVKQWSVTHDEKKLIQEWDNIVALFPKLKLPTLDKITTYTEFNDIYGDISDSWYGMGSFKHYYLNDSQSFIRNYFLNKYLSENEPNPKLYWKITEMNLWENEKWNTYVPDTKENREVVLYLNERFKTIVKPEREKVYNFFGSSFKPIAVSLFTLAPEMFDIDEIDSKISSRSSRYASDKVISKFQFKESDISNISNDILFNSLFYKNGIRNKLNLKSIN